MIVVQCEQNSSEWVRARLGLPTASNFDLIVTRSGKASSSADKYLAKLAAEWFLGQSLDDYQSGFMERGHDLEPQAIAAYEFAHDVDVQRVGLCLRDDRSAGASPDGLVGSDGLLEIKNRGAASHMLAVLNGPDNDHFVQVQGQLWVCERKWVDLQLSHPSLPHVTRRYERDEDFIAILAAEVGKFAKRLADAKAKLAKDKAAYDASKPAPVEDDVPACIAP